jgi:hypothetical protein
MIEYAEVEAGMKKILMLFAFSFFISSVMAPAAVKGPAKDRPAAGRNEILSPAALAAQGAKNHLPRGGWFTWQFDKKPRLGTAIIKIRVYSAAGKQESLCEITGESGMPSMPAHDTGRVKFQLNKKGDYLLPVNVVMPGDWRIIIRIKRDGKEIFAGKTDFNV